jgi:UDP-glucose 4-epimerase
VNALVTGGAGFIGSNLVRCLGASGARVRVLDDLSTGNLVNLHDLNGSVDFIRGDVRDWSAVSRAMIGASVVYHLAGRPSVARSLRDSFVCHDVNVNGTLSVLTAARDAGVDRFVFASSSAVYGETPTLPQHEAMSTHPLSPYGASKLAAESYCRAFARTFGLPTVSLRFFNVFGPRQNTASEFAAVVPCFVNAMSRKQPPGIFGDGLQTRDFTYVANAIQACVLAGETSPEIAGEVVNVGCGTRTSLLQLIAILNQLMGTNLRPQFALPRAGDVRDSQAAVAKAKGLLGYEPLISMREGLAQTVEWLVPQTSSRGGAKSVDMTA